MRFKGEVAYPYFIYEVRDPRAKGRNVSLDMLDLGSAWVVV